MIREIVGSLPPLGFCDPNPNCWLAVLGPRSVLATCQDTMMIHACHAGCCISKHWLDLYILDASGTAQAEVPWPNPPAPPPRP